MTTKVDITYQYPPELLNLLVDTIPLLNRSKMDVLTFFRGAGIKEELLVDLNNTIVQTPHEVNKYVITRTILVRLNERGETTLRERREVLRRVVQIENFDSCWPNDQLKAKGLVASIREVIAYKDAFTRMNQAREQERSQRVAEREREIWVQQERSAKIQASKAELYSLFDTDMSSQSRGKRLESALNNLFGAYGILIKEAFHLVGEHGEGIIEQIDGVISVSEALYFVEMKWYSLPVGVPEISQHLVRLISRAESRGLVISARSFTEPAIDIARGFLQQRIVILSTLKEFVMALEAECDLTELIIKKTQAAQTHKNPYFNPFEIA